MAVGVYLNFQGNCRDAAEFYANAFQTELPKILTYSDAPGSGGGEQPESVKKLVLHASMEIAGDEVMMSDAPPDSSVTVGNLCDGPAEDRRSGRRCL